MMIGKIIKAGVLGLFLTGILTSAYTQQKSSKVQSREQEVDLEELFYSAEQSIKRDPQAAFDDLEKSLEISIKNKDKLGEGRTYFLLGEVNSEFQQYDLAVSYYNRAVGIFENLDVPDQMNQAYYKLAWAYEQQLFYDKSLDYYKKYLEYVEKKKNTDEIIKVKYDIARIYTREEKYNKALTEYNSILRTEEERKNKTGIATANSHLGEIYLKQENTEQAIYNYKKSVQVAEETRDDKIVTYSLRNLGKAYRQSKQYDKEMEVQQRSRSINEESNKLDEVYTDNLNIAEVYLEQKEPKEAFEYIEQSVKISEQIGDIKRKGDALKTLSKAYNDAGEYNKALLAYQEYSAIVDTIHKKREAELEEDLQTIAAVNRKLQRIELLEKDHELNERTLILLQKEQKVRDNELRLQKNIMLILILIIIILSVSSYIVFRSSRQKRKANLLLALKSLRSQMNPHFIFNSLNSVNSFIAENNERMANKYLSEFSQLMRSVLENSKHDFIPLSSEIDMLKLYLKLEHFRFKEKFDYLFEVQDNMGESEFEIPPMLIQPYIENAIWHGLRYKENKGFLKVELKRNKQHLIVEVTDDGIGRRRSQELKTKHQRTTASTGHKNTKSRLDIINEIYKTRFSVEIEDLDEEKNTGTRVMIHIPLRKREV